MDLGPRQALQEPIVTSPLLNMLLGAALVAIGVLAAALADRIRDIRGLRGRTPLSTVRAEITPALSTIEAAPEMRPTKTRAPLTGIKSQPHSDKEDVRDLLLATTEARRGAASEVIAALVAAGYKKTFATEATIACKGIECATVEDWTRAALRRCAGEMS